MFTQFPCNTCVFALSCAGSYLFCFVFCFLFVCLCVFLFLLQCLVLSRSQSRRKCFTLIRAVANGPRPFHPLCIQLFWERLSEKSTATILKGIVGDFKCTVFQRNLKESYGRPLIYVCECWRKVTKVGSTAKVVRNSVLIISHITSRDCRVHFIFDKRSRNSCIWMPRVWGRISTGSAHSYIVNFLFSFLRKTSQRLCH